MAIVDWTSIMEGREPDRSKGRRANVRFFDAYNENKEKSLKEGRPIFDTIPSVSIQYPGMDETVRRIEPQDIKRWPELYANYKAGSEQIVDGTPLTECPPIPGSAVRELQYIGFKTVEQLAEASDEVKRKLGTSGRFVDLARKWLDAANSTQGDVVKLTQILERERTHRKKLEEKLELLMQRIEANEGTDLRDARKEVIQSVPDALEDEFDGMDEVADVELKRRGRPRKV